MDTVGLSPFPVNRVAPVYGEGRGAAACDYDGDGRVDLAVAQNGAATKLFWGVAGRPGLRLRLLGPPGNPSAVGAVVRLIGKTLAGPARCIQAGTWLLVSG